jgi:hypothetical protein
MALIKESPMVCHGYRMQGVWGTAIPGSYSSHPLPVEDENLKTSSVESDAHIIR